MPRRRRRVREQTLTSFQKVHLETNVQVRHERMAPQAIWSTRATFVRFWTTSVPKGLPASERWRKSFTAVKSRFRVEASGKQRPSCGCSIACVYKYELAKRPKVSGAVLEFFNQICQRMVCNGRGLN